MSSPLLSAAARSAASQLAALRLALIQRKLPAQAEAARLLRCLRAAPSIESISAALAFLAKHEG